MSLFLRRYSAWVKTVIDGFSRRKLSQAIQEAHLGAAWSVSQTAIPDGELPFLAAGAVAEYCDLAGLPAEATPFLQSTAQEISGVEDLKQLAWHCRHTLHRRQRDPRQDIHGWQPFSDLLGEDAGVFYLLIALSALPQARDFHRARGISDTVARHTYSDTAIWAEDYREKHGRWGVDLRILPWLYNHLSGDLYRLGRLQFVQRPFRQKLHAFRCRASREVVVLSDSGIRYRSDGQIDGVGGESDPDSWTSRLEIAAEQVVGNRICPTGVALRGRIVLPLDRWERILTFGNPILEIHIPAGSPMDFDACGRSFHHALDFFPRHFPDRPFQGFCCTSWLLNTQFQDWLSPASNMARFQKELYLFPTFSRGRSGVDRIFGRDIEDFSAAPRDTTLRRVVADGLQSGGYLRSGGALLFGEDLDWGAQVYRTMHSKCWT